MRGLKGQFALVTGSSRGIGRSIALRLAQEGVDVALNYVHSESEANEVRQQIEALGQKAIALQADLSQADEAIRLVDTAVQQLGRLDILVNNAGGSDDKPFTEMTIQDYEEVVDLNLKGVFFASQAFAKQLIALRLPGRIINISSVHEEIPFPGQAAYCAAKGGVKLLTRNLAIELAPYQITVNSVAPGAIETEGNESLVNNESRLQALLQQIPLRRLGQPEEVAGIVAFLASADAAYVTGSTYFIDGGLTWYYNE